jgi:hypothetical protein
LRSGRNEIAGEQFRKALTLARNAIARRSRNSRSTPRSKTGIHAPLSLCRDEQTVRQPSFNIRFAGGTAKSKREGKVSGDAVIERSASTDSKERYMRITTICATDPIFAVDAKRRRRNYSAARVAQDHARPNRSVGICLLALMAQIGLCAAAAPQAVKASGAAVAPPMDQQTEMALALSACPPSVATKAAVYVLDKTGYIKIRESQNGFTALVQHSVPGAVEPQCMDAEGTRTFLHRMLKVAELRAQGLGPDEIKRAIADAFAKGAFQAPSKPGVDYMLSMQNAVPDDKGVVAHFPPHVMFYAPYLTNADLGSDGQGADGPLFVAGEGTPFALVIVPVAPHTGHVHSPEDSK